MSRQLKKSIVTILIIVFIIVIFSSCYGNGGGKDKYNSGESHLVTSPTPQPEVIGNVFKYNYNEATENNTQKSIEIQSSDLTDTTLIIPKREGYIFDGWYCDWTLSTRFADEQGKIVISEESFDKCPRNLYAKWENENAPIYPILMVFVTEVDATLKKRPENIEVSVKYKMTDNERIVCSMMSQTLQDYLNAMLNGKVKFEIDTYFTKDVVGSESFSCSIGHWDNHTEYDYGLFAYTLPELGGGVWDKYGVLSKSMEDIENDGILKNYKTVITTFGMNDFDYELHCVGGSSGRKYVKMHLETLLNEGAYTANYLLDENSLNADSFWESFMGFYLHEFTHSVELYSENKAVNSMDYHDVYKKYAFEYWSAPEAKGQSGNLEKECIRRYLLYEIEFEGELFGITPEFWEK